MADHDSGTPIPAQRQESTAADSGQALNFPPTPPLAAKHTDRTTSRRAALSEWWEDAWTEGGVLHQRWEDLRQAHELGWHEMANWIKTVLALAGFAVVALFLDGAAGVLADALHRLLTAAPRVQIGTDTFTGVLAVVDQPVRSYIAQHSAGLAVSGSTLYTLWQVAGLVGLVGGFLRSTAARLLWTAWGTGSAAMIWSAAPELGRTLATGIAVAVWLLASAFALRGLQLRRAVVVHVAPRIHNEIREIHVPADRPADDTPDNVHQLQR
ncbi:hypothetical protein ACFYPC_36815 [Streptomyces sp. NPDC005808]|uniref:hypothetical protein n=1 Tax=Streptomyces sp. NPDC005808 TaxID=3364734 RepID=UPI0036B2CDB2